MFNEELFIIAVYCLIDEYYHRLFPNGVRKRDFFPQLTDVEALTIAIVGEFLGLERDKAIFEYFYKHYRDWFPDLHDRSLLVRQWANLWQLVDRFKVQNLRIRKGWTLLAKWFRKILAHTVCVFLNLKLGRNPLDFAGLVSVK